MARTYTGGMRRALPLLVLLLAGVGLVGCGDTSLPGPAAGDVLSAPTQLNFGGRVVQVQAQPVLAASRLQVTVSLRTRAAGLPKLTPAEVYVVSDGAVWQAPLRSRPSPNCGGLCRSAVAGAAAPGVRLGERVTVVVRVLDGRGRAYLLRGPAVAVTAPPAAWARP